MAAIYHTLKATEPEKYDFAESELNQLGYALMLEARRTRDAIEVFKLNVEACPKSSNVYDSLADAYMRDGQNALAIRFYEKALDLDPKNSNAAAQLQKLRPE